MNKIVICLICVLVLSCQSKTNQSKKDESKHNKNVLAEVSKKSIELDTLLNTNDYLVLGKKMAKIKVVQSNEVENFPTFEILIGNGNDIIIGENIDYDDVKMYRKYNLTSTFEDYKVTIYNGKLAAPDFSSNPSTKRFVTRIKEACKKGINFAGHYTLVTWGCGSACQSGVVVDRKTGVIYSGYGTALGAEFRKNSKMIIRNVGAIDTNTNLIELCAYCDVNHEVWTGTEFHEVQ
ncbi:hypothetical protein [uncultured Kordia sp.]|uniref:hypothetical protein n=1 Tax=uncultured Kordia sp. TaxID=507699 RepID=UPI002615D085|nr:hypothetical protein [uncultured Kordia sp.]